jgi:hypothetical protein
MRRRVGQCDGPHDTEDEKASVKWETTFSRFVAWINGHDGSEREKAGVASTSVTYNLMLKETRQTRGT